MRKIRGNTLLIKETGLRLVEFVPGDKKNPLNISKARKWFYTFLLGIICFVVALGSAIVTGDISGPKEYFGVTEEIIILASVTMFFLDLGSGLVYLHHSQKK